MKPPLHRGRTLRQIGGANAILLEHGRYAAVTVAALQATANGEDPLLLVLADLRSTMRPIPPGHQRRPCRRRGPPGDLRHRADGPGDRLRLHRSQRTVLLGGPVHVPIKRFVEKPDRAQRSNSDHRWYLEQRHVPVHWRHAGGTVRLAR